MWHIGTVPTQITIRHVPDDVRTELAARAARRGQSMQRFLLLELQRLASHPTLDEWLDEARRRVEAADSRVSAEVILEARDMGRR